MIWSLRLRERDWFGQQVERRTTEQQKWLFSYSLSFSGCLFDGVEAAGGVIIRNTAMGVRIVCQNQGRTPAWITEIYTCLDIVDFPPAIPDFTHADPVLLEPEPLAVEQKFSPKGITLQRYKGRETGLMTVIYGIVKYRVFSDRRTRADG